MSSLFNTENWTDRVEVDGAFSDGFVTVPFAYVCDGSFSDTAFRLFSFFVGLASNGAAAAPSVDEQRKILRMSKDKYYAARKQLVDRGLLSIHQDKKQENNQWKRNTYRIHLVPSKPGGHEGDRAGGKSESTNLPPREGQADRENTHSEVIHNSQFIPRPENQDTGHVENRNTLACASGKTAKPQFIPRPDFRDTENQDAIIGSNSIHSCNPIQPTEQPVTASQVDTARDAHHDPSRPDGRTDGDAVKDRVEESSGEAYDRLASSAINRNLIRSPQTRSAWESLVSQGHSPADIQTAWDLRQAQAKRCGRTPRYYPQLKRWLETEAAAEISRLAKAGGGHVIPEGAPKNLPALANADEAFGRVYWAFLDARQQAGIEGIDPDDDPVCVRLRDRMHEERAAAYARWSESRKG